MQEERFARQLGLFGQEGQDKLSKSRVTLVGHNLASEFLLASLASLGIGNLYLLSPQKKSINSFLSDGNPKHLKKFFHRFNHDLNFYWIDGSISSKNSCVLIPESDFIIDLTHDSLSKYHTAVHSEKTNTPMILGYSANERALIAPREHISNLEEIAQASFENEEDAASAAITAGLISDEIRKVILPREDEYKISYDLTLKKQNIPKSSKVLMIGAGALGNWLGIGLSLLGISGTIVDDDKIETTNLNRQFFFYDSVSKYKSKTLAKKLSNKFARFDYSCSRFTLENVEYGKFDLIASCVDNIKARLDMNEYASKHNIPLVNGGTDPFSGNVSVFNPHYTPCLSCQEGISYKDLQPAVQPASCVRQAENSVVISNLVTAGLMLERIKEVLSGQKYFDRIVYSSERGVCTMNLSSSPSCSCCSK
jgi:molybdopterin/thiamine biosynthesis adenylyltransferase